MSIFGETLRQARAHKGVTVKEAEQATRISRLYLSALEDEHFEALPPLIYQRGIVRNYATYLDLDPHKLLAMFEEARGGLVEPEVAPSVPPLNMPSHWAPNFAIIAFILVLGMIVFAWFYSAFLAPSEAAPTATSAVETVTPLPADDSSAQALIRSLVPSPTATIEPTATPEPEVIEPTARSEQTAEPRATEIQEAAPGDSDAPVEPDADEAAAPAEETAEESEAPSGPTVRVLFTPTADVYLTVYGDGELKFEGLVPAGTQTEVFEAGFFQVFTSDLNDTWVTNLDTGQNFYMSDIDGEGSFDLAPM